MAWWETALKIVAKTPEFLADATNQIATQNVKHANKTLKRSDLSDEQRSRLEENRDRGQEYLNRNKDSGSE